MKAFAIRAGTFLLRFIPARAAGAAALVVADLCWGLLAARRRVLHQNLAHLVPEAGRGARRRLVRATFRNLALCTVDFLRLPLLGTEALAKLVEIRGREHFDEALARGRGVILVTAHLGNIDLAAASLGALGLPTFSMTEDLEPGLADVYKRYREITGLRLLSSTREIASAYRALKRGAVLVLAADRVLGNGGLVVEFGVGRRAVPEGPARFALRSGAAIVPVYVVLNPAPDAARRYLGFFEPPIAVDRTDLESAEGLTLQIARAMARTVREFPDQWFVFQPGWIEARS